ncbi:hypothetical protein Tsp_03542 [Trichinella spiralis]|uniref:hypothetical protein n=1 Tax=Trichinella spiralis TaxID=6334 RepID=UPI0001EFB628|nr:hypothetical protein Tsp_03542 [Trichinella spiralis]
MRSSHNAFRVVYGLPAHRTTIHRCASSYYSVHYFLVAAYPPHAFLVPFQCCTPAQRISIALSEWKPRPPPLHQRFRVVKQNVNPSLNHSALYFRPHTVHHPSRFLYLPAILQNPFRELYSSPAHPPCIHNDVPFYHFLHYSLTVCWIVGVRYVAGLLGWGRPHFRKTHVKSWNFLHREFTLLAKIFNKVDVINLLIFLYLEVLG